MFLQKIYILSALFFINTFCYSTEYNSSIPSESNFNNKYNHWQYDDRNSNIQYLIICPKKYITPAQLLGDMHSNSVDMDYRLTTEIVTTEDIFSNSTKPDLKYAIREYIINRITDDLTFLLLMGDEFDIPPISNGEYLSDDFYSTSNLYTGLPRLVSGRIPISTYADAMTIVEKIINYTLNPTPGAWRGKIALVADDMHRACAYTSEESSHVLSSNQIYDSLKSLIDVQPFYGLNYNLQQTNTGCEYPNLTEDLIHTINNGIALINYIGHGDPETWSGEKIIDRERDIPLIKANNGKLAIWVAGTCSFGKYNGETSFMEDLLIKKDGAIAIIGTTTQIDSSSNWNYIKHLFGLHSNDGIEDYINNRNSYRLGELVWKSKNLNSHHKFHTFGDPALRLPFPRYTDNLIEKQFESFKLIKENNITLNETFQNSNFIIRGNEKELYYVNNSDSIKYKIPGNTYSQINSTNNEICFRIPLDAGSCDSCAIIQIYQDDNNWNGKMQIEQKISIDDSNYLNDDDIGPNITIYQLEKRISEGSILLANYDLIVKLNDSSGINLMETIGHGIQYNFDNSLPTYVNSNKFVYTNCNSGELNIPVPITLNSGNHTFYLEAWDGINNKSTVNFQFEVRGNLKSSNLLIDQVFPFPNPFSDYTDFTMFVLSPPAKITISIYSILGNKVITLDTYIAEENFISIPWDGKDLNNQKIANGAYFYHVSAEKNGNIVYEDIFKLAKIE